MKYLDLLGKKLYNSLFMLYKSRILKHNSLLFVTNGQNSEALLKLNASFQLNLFIE